MTISRVAAVLAAAVLMAGCGAGSGGGGGSSTPAVVIPPAPTLTSLSIDPPASTIDIAGAQALSVTGHYSDGSLAAVSAAWTISSGSSVNLSSALGTAITASAKDEGTTTVQASFGGKSASATITVEWSTPADPGDVFVSEGGSISKVLPGSGGLSGYASGGSEGLAINAANTALYSHDGATVYKHDLVTGANTVFGSLPPVDPAVGGAWFGLDHDASGRIYAQQVGGRLARMTEATGVVEDLVGSGGSWDLAVTRDGTTLYDLDILGSGAFTRIDIATGARSTAGYLPYEAAYYGFFIGSGIAVNRRGEVYASGVSANAVYQYVDLNGDGDMTDAGEFSTFGAMGAPSSGVMVFGLCVGRGRSVLANVMPYDTAVGSGVWRLADFNMDGDAADASETYLYSESSTGNGRDGGCIAAPR